MSTQTTTGSGRPSRTAVQRGLADLRDTARKILDPLLMEATREAIQSNDNDAKSPGGLKKSVRGLLVDYRTFSAAFFAAVDKEIDGAVEDVLSGRKDGAAPPPAVSGSLSLVEYDQMEEQMMVGRIASRIRNAADSAYTPLTQRIARALNMPALGDRENPFHPLRYCRALGDAVDKVGFKGEDRQTVVKAFDAALQGPLVTMYAELNQQLEQQGVQEVTATGFRNTVAGFRNTMAGTGRVTQAGQVAGAITGATAEQLLSALYHRMQVQPVGMASAAVPATSSASMFERVDPLPSAAPGFPATGSAGAVPIAPGVPVQFAAIEPAVLA